MKYSGSARLFWYRLIYLDDQLDSKFDQLRSQSSCRKWCDWNIFSKHIETMVKCAICWDRIIHHPRQQGHSGSSPRNEEIRLKKQRKVQNFNHLFVWFIWRKLTDVAQVEGKPHIQWIAVDLACECADGICLLHHFSLSQWQMCNLLDMTHIFMLGKLSNFNFYFMVLNDWGRFATLHFLTLQILLTTQSALWEPILLEDHILVLLMDKILHHTVRLPLYNSFFLPTYTAG